MTGETNAASGIIDKIGIAGNRAGAIKLGSQIKSSLLTTAQVRPEFIVIHVALQAIQGLIIIGTVVDNMVKVRCITDRHRFLNHIVTPDTIHATPGFPFGRSMRRPPDLLFLCAATTVTVGTANTAIGVAQTFILIPGDEGSIVFVVQIGSTIMTSHAESPFF